MKKILLSLNIIFALLLIVGCGSDSKDKKEVKSKKSKTTQTTKISSSSVSSSHQTSSSHQESRTTTTIQQPVVQSSTYVEQPKPVQQPQNNQPQFANEAEAEAYYDGFIDHEARAREAERKANTPVVDQNGNPIYKQNGEAWTQGEREDAIANGQGDPAVQAETQRLQEEWAKQNGYY